MDELAAAAAVLAMEVDSDGGDGLGLDAPAGGFANDLLQPTTFEVRNMDLSEVNEATLPTARSRMPIRR